MRTHSLRIFPTKNQIDELYKLSSIRNDIWNTLINLQQNEYNINKKIFSNYTLHKLITTLKHTTKLNWNNLNSKSIQVIANQIYNSYISFYSLIKKDNTAKPPQKILDENLNTFHTLIFNQVGWYFNNENLIINKIPFQYKSNINNIDILNIKEIRVKFKNNKWLVDLIIEDNIKYETNLTIETKVLAIDLGIKTLGTGIDNYGNKIIIKNKSKKINQYFYKQIKKIQQKRSKTLKNSNRNIYLKSKLNRLYQKKNSQIKQTLHIQSKQLVNMNYNTIVIGDLTVKKLMLTTGINENKKSLRRNFHNSNITMFLNFLKYKCQFKNINLETIDERWTTQLNCLTKKVFLNKIELIDREVNLTDNITIDRDLNSAINILHRWFDNHIASVNKPLEINSNVLLDIISTKNIYL